MRRLLFAGLLCVATTMSARGWWDEGHMQVAAAAYERLTPTVRAKVDALNRLNPQYPGWIAGWPPSKTAQFAFVRAATWADDIKLPELGYTDRSDKPTNPEAGRNIGYHDHLMHKYTGTTRTPGFQTTARQSKLPTRSMQ